MRYLAYPLVVALLSLGACASQEKLAKEARISQEQATRTAESSVGGGRAKDTHLEQEDGRTMYEVELLDRNDKTRTVWVDAETGRIIKKDR